VHAAVGILCCTLITYNARAIVHRFATLVVEALHFILLALDRQSCALFAKRRAESTCRTPQTLHIRLIGERAPPPLLALT
jgi:hypothetical protein